MPKNEQRTKSIIRNFVSYLHCNVASAQVYENADTNTHIHTHTHTRTLQLRVVFFHKVTHKMYLQLLSFA